MMLISPFKPYLSDSIITHTQIQNKRMQQYVGERECFRTLENGADFRIPRKH